MPAVGEARVRWAAIVLAAGRGTRMRSKTPKVAHPIAGRPVLRHVVEAAREAGAARVAVVVGADEGAGAVRSAAGPGVTFAVQPEPLGTGDAVERARDAVSGAEFILILNGDVPLVLPETLRRLCARVEDSSLELALLTACVPVEEYGVLELDGDRIVRIAETKAAEGIDRAAEQFINSGQYAARAAWLWAQLPRIAASPNGERYLTELAAFAHESGNPAAAVVTREPQEVRGINDRTQLAEAESAMRERVRRKHMLDGVTLVDPAATYIDAGVQIGADTTIAPNTHLLGETSIGADCEIGPNSYVRDARIGDRCVVRMSTIEESVLEDGVDMGPYSHLRPGTHLCAGVHIGNYAEVKGSRLGRGTKMGHFSYIGDATVGDDVNIGAGTITANYDGASKHRTAIGDGAFIGSDTMLVAPVRIGRGARTAAGSVVTRDVPEGVFAAGNPCRVVKSL